MTTAILIAAFVLNLNTSPAAELFDAVKLNDFAKVEHFVAKGQDVNAADELGMTPLMYASRHQDGVLMDYLISNGANVNAQNNAGATAIFIAIRHGHLSTVAKLITAGADLSIRNDQGNRALDLARMYDKPMIESLIYGHLRSKRS